MEKNKKNKKGSPIGWVIFFIILISILSDSDVGYQLRKLQYRMQFYGINGITAEELAGICILLFIVIMFVVIVVKAAVKKIRAAVNDTGYHSHDRLNTAGAIKEKHYGIDHYKIQLDGFLSSGIIEKEEYNVLLKKYTKALKNEK